MVDSRGKSLTESLANIAPGFIISMVANALLVPLFTPYYSSGDPALIWTASLITTIIFTLLSFGRVYGIRRAFANMGENENLLTILKRLIKK